jgi:hypothetical protein
VHYLFVPSSGGRIPDGAQPHGHEKDGTPLWVARSPGITDPNFLDGIHPGKVRPAFGAALIPLGGRELSVANYEVLMEAGIWMRGSGSQIPDGAIVCGREENGEPLFVGRANFNGGVHRGKNRFAFGAAFIGFTRRYFSYFRNRRHIRQDQIQIGGLPCQRAA